MLGPRVALTLKSNNIKTGPIPVSTTEETSCAASCPLNGAGCYAQSGPLALFWKKVSRGEAGLSWHAFVDKVRALPDGQVWRHNQAGDLPGIGDTINGGFLDELVSANKGKRGFTYTHKPPQRGKNAAAIARANEGGFTVNLSADTLPEADTLAGLAIGPVVVVLPSDVKENLETPEGRKVVICPAVTREGVTCSTCKLCAWKDRKVIIGFPAHGTGAKKASVVAKG